MSRTKRERDQINECFLQLKNAVPTLRAETNVSKAQILQKATEYIRNTKKKNDDVKQDMEDLKKVNDVLEAEIAKMEKELGERFGETFVEENLHEELSTSAATTEDIEEMFNTFNTCLTISDVKKNETSLVSSKKPPLS